MDNILFFYFIVLQMTANNCKNSHDARAPQLFSAH